MSKQTNGFVWFKHTDSLFERSTGSGHSQSFLKTRYNAVAATMLDGTGKVLPNAVFPDESLIVKELYTDSTTLDQYAILYKKSTSQFADQSGWVWGYIKSDGTVLIPASKKGGSCINCHSQADNIDYMLMNKYFP